MFLLLQIFKKGNIDVEIWEKTYFPSSVRNM